MDSAATTALVLGIVSLFCALAAPFAIWQGNVATGLARQARVSVPGGATVGIVLGWIVCGLTVLVIALYVAIFATLLGAA